MNTDIIQNAFAIIGILTAALVALSAGGVAAFALTLRQKEQTLKDAIEKIYLSLPVDKRLAIREGVQFIGGAADFLDEVTDGELETP